MQHISFKTLLLSIIPVLATHATDFSPSSSEAPAEISATTSEARADFTHASTAATKTSGSSTVKKSMSGPVTSYADTGGVKKALAAPTPMPLPKKAIRFEGHAPSHLGQAMDETTAKKATMEKYGMMEKTADKRTLEDPPAAVS
jgi:hypothetical protein